MTKKIKPFDAGSWFPIHNAVFDVIMPRLSPNGWKVLCVAIRQTWGWVADGTDPQQRKQSDRISYSQFKDKTGIGSYSTISRALDECLDAGYMKRHKVGEHPGTGKPTFAYELNTDYELPVESPTTETVVEGPTTETVVAAATETVVAPATETVVTKQRKQKKQSDGGGHTKEQEQAVELLSDFGVSQAVATRLAAQCSLEDVRSWLAYAKAADGLQDPVAFVVARLRDGEAPPDNGKATEEDDRRRYLEWLQ